MTGVQLGKNSGGGLLTSTVSVVLLRTQRGWVGFTTGLLFCQTILARWLFTTLLTLYLPRHICWPLCCQKLWYNPLRQIFCEQACLVPTGNWNFLLDMRPVGMRGAFGVPTLEVAMLSAMMEGMEQLRTPFWWIFWGWLYCWRWWHTPALWPGRVAGLCWIK